MADHIRNVFDAIGFATVCSFPQPVSIPDTVTVSANGSYNPVSKTAQSTISASANPNMDLFPRRAALDSLSGSDLVSNTVEAGFAAVDSFKLSDGMSEQLEQSMYSAASAFALSSSPPDAVVSITSPAAGVYPFGFPLQFSATYVKPFGTVYVADFRWTSDLDGLIAFGVSEFTCNWLSVGTHLIKIYDVAEKDFASVAVVITSIPPPDRPEDLHG